MKKKFLVFTLCFTLVFTSINYKKVNALDLVISPTMLATVSTLAIAYGLTIKDDNNLYDLSRDFVSWCGDSYDSVVSTFNRDVVLLSTGAVAVGQTFLGLFDNFLNDNIDRITSDSTVSYDYVMTNSIPHYKNYSKNYFQDNPSIKPSFVTSFPGYGGYSSGNIKINNIDYNVGSGVYNSYSLLGFYVVDSGNLFAYFISNDSSHYLHYYLGTLWGLGLPYEDYYSNSLYGKYNNTDVLNNTNEDGSIGLLVPGNLSDLVGSGSSDVIYDGTNSLPFDGVVSVPNVDDPSIGLDGSISFPMDNVGDVPDVDDPSIPNDTPFANITEYIIGLVVPSDSYWTDTFGGLYDNFTNSFPLVNMDNFNNLVTGEKKFPNIDIDIMGVKGRVVNGDVVNSIVDWLRPIIAGFMMLCLMLFNYRKIYKTIRGVEPFQGIAQGTSDFRTGISEYNYMGSGLSKSDYEANEKELAKALHDYYQDTGKTYKVRI